MTAKRYGLYSRRLTPLHRLHPLTKLLCALLVLIAPLVVSDLTGSACCVLLSLVLIASSWAWSSVRTLLPIVAMMAVVTVIVWPMFFRGGQELVRVGSLYATDEGVERGLAMACRLVSLVLIGIVFLTVTKVEEFTASLSMLGLPFVVTFALMLSFRLAPTFLSTVGTIRDAQTARGHTIDQGNPIRRALKHIPLIIPVILHALRSTDVLSMALESRAFGKKAKRTSVLSPRLSWRDPLAYVTAGIVLAASIVWRFTS